MLSEFIIHNKFALAIIAQIRSKIEIVYQMKWMI